MYLTNLYSFINNILPLILSFVTRITLILRSNLLFKPITFELYRFIILNWNWVLSFSWFRYENHCKQNANKSIQYVLKILKVILMLFLFLLSVCYLTYFLINSLSLFSDHLLNRLSFCLIFQSFCLICQSILTYQLFIVCFIRALNYIFSLKFVYWLFLNKIVNLFCSFKSIVCFISQFLSLNHTIGISNMWNHYI